MFIHLINSQRDTDIWEDFNVDSNLPPSQLTP